MRTFVLSDVHGQYHSFLEMLDLIHFTDEDFLYVVGDVIDRGDDGVEVLQDLMKRPNVELFMGNHELMMLNAILYERKLKSGELLEDPYSDHLTPIELWTHPSNGGRCTRKAFFALQPSEQDEMVAYLKGLHLIHRIKVGGRSFHLSHSYSLPRRFKSEIHFQDLDSKEAERVVWESLFDEPDVLPADHRLRPFYYTHDTYVVGHVFTQRLGHVTEDGQGLILKRKYRGYDVINMDCGMALRSRSSRLGCLQLETLQEYYVPLIHEGER